MRSEYARGYHGTAMMRKRGGLYMAASATAGIVRRAAVVVKRFAPEFEIALRDGVVAETIEQRWRKPEGCVQTLKLRSFS